MEDSPKSFSGGLQNLQVKKSKKKVECKSLTNVVKRLEGGSFTMSHRPQDYRLPSVNIWCVHSTTFSQCKYNLVDRTTKTEVRRRRYLRVQTPVETRVVTCLTQQYYRQRRGKIFREDYSNWTHVGVGPSKRMDPERKRMNGYCFGEMDRRQGKLGKIKEGT